PRDYLHAVEVRYVESAPRSRAVAEPVYAFIAARGHRRARSRYSTQTTPPVHGAYAFTPPDVANIRMSACEKVCRVRISRTRAAPPHSAPASTTLSAGR